MQIFKSFVDQSLAIWKDSTGAARVGIALLLAICVGSIIGVGIWSAQPSYVALNNVEPDSLTEATASLDQSNINYKIENGVILVDRRKLSDANKALVQSGVVEKSRTPAPSMASGLWSPAQQKEEAIRTKESHIANALMRIESVKDAKVILSIPKTESRMRKSDQPSASVSLTLSRVHEFDDMQASSIAELVASSVPGLKIEKVVISDQHGISYKPHGALRHLSKQEQYRASEEFLKVAKAQDLLFSSLGIGNAIVKVTADYDFPDRTIDARVFDLDNAVKATEKTTNETGKTGIRSAEGATGMTSNADGQFQNDSNINDRKFEEIDIKRIVPETSTLEIIRTPVLKGMTVSVAVNSKDLPVDENNQVSPELKKQFESMVKNAIGFDDSRDQFSLEFVKFRESSDQATVVANPIPWDNIHMVLKNISLGFAGLIALLVGLMAFRKLTPIPVSVDPVPAGRESQISQLSELVKQNPEVFSQIITAWSNADPLTDDNATPERQQRQAA